jgi:DNA-binding MarR family transcriptional regulator
MQIITEGAFVHERIVPAAPNAFPLPELAHSGGAGSSRIRNECDAPGSAQLMTSLPPAGDNIPATASFMQNRVNRVRPGQAATITVTRFGRECGGCAQHCGLRLRMCRDRLHAWNSGLTLIVATSTLAPMKKTRARRKKQSRGPQVEEAVFLDLMRTTDMLSRGLAGVIKTEDLSATQYNVLRILRGSLPGLACGEIASRMITRDPDVTRLLDRLEKRGLITRWREKRDRRTVSARITAEGLRVLGRLDRPIQAAHRKQLGHLGRERLRALTGLLAQARGRLE